MTTRRRIKELGCSCRTPTKKPFLKPYMVKKRLVWAKQHQSWTVDDWKKCMLVCRIKYRCIRWYADFKTRGCICKRKSTSRPSVREGNVERVRESFRRSPQKSTVNASRELNIPQQTVWKILRKSLKFHPYRLQLLQALKPDNKAKRQCFCEEMQLTMVTEDFIESLVFSDEGTFHLSGKVHKHNVRIWALEKPNNYVKHVRDSPKVNMFCAISREKMYGPFFFVEATVTGNQEQRSQCLDVLHPSSTIVSVLTDILPKVGK
ncbi:hypothetical protein ANN_19526 [Periplaneta americana]|uniref:Transposase Tc1-like domain-containing protein n=1 Tax=Periplaneta americana TaxID=6978 RepID=A0ABQ8SA64_PERAM|nr:hypothetical protein ANN_19526 [Periplaneta americana]